MIYYVIQNNDTGEYWRGKGSTNHWGKYFNQASIYRVKGQAKNAVKNITLRSSNADIKILTIQINIIE